ncbi:uncharacterized protein LOC132295016 [Cornus florida]|uniref:uncharacterized protein LOC132295016 n=1 Tax=Cornus florida TaxID=4283 RepID=UPI002897C64B|nr:uncharacterized protein LOC132295016 [Cornus florida]XP_059649072.1 uncharacterized protein LOC132295016 [Cornus florida]
MVPFLELVRAEQRRSLILPTTMFGTRKRMWSAMKAKKDPKKRKITPMIPLRRRIKKAALETNELFPIDVVSEYKLRKISGVRDWPPYCGPNTTLVVLEAEPSGEENPEEDHDGGDTGASKMEGTGV